MGYESYIDETIEDIDKLTELSLMAIGLLVKNAAVLLAPVNKYSHGGTLRQSINYVTNHRERVVQIGSSSEYAEWVEYGTGIYNKFGRGRMTPWVFFNELEGDFFRTVGQKPQPFMTPAFEDQIKDIQNRVEAYFRELDR